MARPTAPITRFAPSPTGMLHIGGARTALFNWLFARHHKGTFLLRIEDTDRQRSTPEAVEAILGGLRWLELDWDGEVVFQSARLERHAEIASRLLERGWAYRCYCTPEELAEMRAAARASGRPIRYDGRWRDRDPAEAPKDVAPVIRFKAPQSGELIIRDHVQGDVRFSHEHLDDLVLLRSDGSPTYMLSVVVDDHDMGITHIIRGDDHLTNAARQMLIYQALDWPVPEFAHIPLIHGADGAKLSKRHGALAVEAYRDMGYLPEAMRNYLLRLGWSHGDDEIISTEQAIAWFDLDRIGRAPARFDMDKLNHLNGHYLRHSDDRRLVEAVARLLRDRGLNITPQARARLEAAMPAFKQRAKTLVELAENIEFLVTPRPLELSEKAARHLTPDARQMLRELRPLLNATKPWTAENLEATLRTFAEKKGVKFGKIAQPVRAALTGGGASPGLSDVLTALGRDEALGRLDDQIGDPVQV